MIRRRLPLPPARQIPWPLKPLQSAQTSLTYDEHRRMVMHIRHDLLKGITPEMVEWWFRHIGGEMDVNGTRLNRYLVWHPLDHIHWELSQPGPDGKVSVGARFRIVEAFGRDPSFYVDVTDHVVRLDSTGITLEGRALGVQITRLNHDFIAADGGTLYVSTLTIGVAVGRVGRFINPLIHTARFHESMGRAWLRHNVEEVGLLEHMVPLVFEQAAATPGRPA